MGKSQHPPVWAVKIYIMEKMHWDYWTYRQQPVRVIREILNYYNAEAEAEKHRT